MAEGASTPQDMTALGWAIANRVGSREFGRTIEEVAHHRNAFESVQKNSHLWSQSAHPEVFTGPNAQAWQQSQATARGILSGAIPDPTGGATLFFSSNHYDPAKPLTAPRGYPTMLEQGRIAASSQYLSTPDKISGMRNYFFLENPYRK